MAQRLKRIGGTLLLIFILFGILQMQFGDIMKGGHDRFFSYGGDGFKNYATILYHVKHDDSWMHYNGMNYPYGEHVLFTDNQPLLANTLKFINQFAPNTFYEIAPIVHWMMLISFILSGVFLLLLFRQFDVADWFGIPVSIGIVMLSPQLLRFAGHFGLAYAVVLPMYLYVLLLFEEKGRRKHLVFLFLIMFLFAQLHFYFFGILSLLTVGYAFFRIVFAKADHHIDRPIWMPSLQLVGLTVLSYILLSIWVKIGNPVTDRPTHPLGFLLYRAQWESIFLNEKAPILSFLNEKLIPFRKTQFEGKSYVGIMALILTLTLLYQWIKGKGKKAFFSQVQSHRLFVRSLFATAFVLVLFAMGLPFTIPGMEKFIRFLGPLSQLRSIGRFGWIFFYVLNLFAFIQLYNLYKSIDSQRVLRYLMLFPILLLWSDGFTFLGHINNHLYKLAELNKNFDQSNEYWFKDINPKDYQAILPIPYFHVGSENYGTEPIGHSFFFSTAASIWSGLPSMGVMMSRTSFSQTEKSMSMVLAAGYRNPKILADLPSDKPLLAFIDKEALGHSKYAYKYQFIYDFGQKVFETNKVIGYKLPLDAFAKAVEKSKRHVRSEIDSRKLYTHGQVLSTDSIPNYLYLPFDEYPTPDAYFSAGALPSNAAILRKEGHQTIFDDRLPDAHKDKAYNVSFWVYVGTQMGPHTNYRLYEYDENDPSKIYTKWDKGTRFDLRILDNGWAFISEVLTLKGDHTKVKIDIYNPIEPTHSFLIDELIFRPVGTDLYQEKDGMVWKNGLFYR